MLTDKLPHICESCGIRFNADEIADILTRLNFEYTFCGKCIQSGIEHFAPQIQDHLLLLDVERQARKEHLC